MVGISPAFSPSPPSAPRQQRAPFLVFEFENLQEPGPPHNDVQSNTLPCAGVQYRVRRAWTDQLKWSVTEGVYRELLCQEERVISFPPSSASSFLC